MMISLLWIRKYELIDKMVFGAEFKKCANKLLATKKDIKVKRAGLLYYKPPFFTFSKSTYISQIKWPLTKLRWLLSRNIFFNSFTFFKANGQLSKCWSKKKKNDFLIGLKRHKFFWPELVRKKKSFLRLFAFFPIVCSSNYAELSK